MDDFEIFLLQYFLKVKTQRPPVGGWLISKKKVTNQSPMASVLNKYLEKSIIFEPEGTVRPIKLWNMIVTIMTQVIN